MIRNLKVQAERGNLAVIRAFVEKKAGSSFTRETVEDLVQAVDEAATNIIVHGYRDGPGEIEIEYQRQPGKIILVIRDNAPCFNPTLVPAPNVHQPLEQRAPGGLGIYLIRQCINEMIYRTPENGGNELTLVKYVSES